MNDTRGDAPRTAILLPWRTGNPHRDAAGDWVTAQLARHHPDLRLHTTRDLDIDGPWCKALHVKAMLDQLEPDIETVIVHDIDVWLTPRPLRLGLQAVRTGTPWSVPHGKIVRLDEAGTAHVTANPAVEGPLWPSRRYFAEPPYRGHPGGGIVIAGRDLLIEVPLDPRYLGWGQEDDSWGLALTTLAGRPHRGTSDLIHLWHPPQPRASRTFGNPTGRALLNRYRAAGGHPAHMRELLAEIPTHRRPRTRS